MTEAPLPDRLRAYLGHQSLTPVWERARHRLERNRLQLTGTISVDLNEEAATRLGGLLRRPYAAGSARVQLASLDEALRRSAAAAGLVAVLGALTGPLIDRAAARDQKAAAWSQVWSALDTGLAAAGLANASWAPAFADSVRRSGLLTRARAPAAHAAVNTAVAVLAEIADGTVLSGGEKLVESRWELGELASTTTGNAHGLDDGTLTAALVLRAIAEAAGEPAPTSPSERRALWETVGVTKDQVSGTVMVWALRPPGTHRWSTMMTDRADLGLVTHLTLHELRAMADLPLAKPGQRVYACENPQVLQAAIRASAPEPLLCFAGNPASAGLTLLSRLIADDATVSYHGDFDWPGVRIAARLFDRGATPWRMGAQDYVDAVSSLNANARLALSGAGAATPWEPGLSAAMEHEGIAIHEEALLPTLLPDLAGRANSPVQS